MNFLTKAFSGANGKIRLIAFIAIFLSLVAFFTPMSFAYDENSMNYLVNYFIGAINSQDGQIFTMILAILVLVLTNVSAFTKKHFKHLFVAY